MYELLRVVKDLREEVDEKLNFTVKFAKQSLEALVSNQEAFVNDFKRNFTKAVDSTKEEFFNVLKLWRMYNRDKVGVSIGDESFGKSPHLWLSIFGKE